MKWEWGPERNNQLHCVGGNPYSSTDLTAGPRFDSWCHGAWDAHVPASTRLLLTKNIVELTEETPVINIIEASARLAWNAQAHISGGLAGTSPRQGKGCHENSIYDCSILYNLVFVKSPAKMREITSTKVQ